MKTFILFSYLFLLIPTHAQANDTDTCANTHMNTNTNANVDTTAAKAREIKIAQAHVAIAKARVNSAKINVEKKNAQWRTDNARYQKLLGLGDAVARRDVDAAHALVETDALEVQLLNSQVEEMMAELIITQVQLEALMAAY